MFKADNSALPMGSIAFGLHHLVENVALYVTSNNVYHCTSLLSVPTSFTNKRSFNSSLPNQTNGITHHSNPISRANCFSLVTSEIRVVNITSGRLIRIQNVIIRIYVVSEELQKLALLSVYLYIMQIFIRRYTYVHIHILCYT